MAESTITATTTTVTVPDFSAPPSSDAVDLSGDGGVLKEVAVEGDGQKPEAGFEVHMHYTGCLADGTKFDSSRKRGSPFSFGLGKNQVIRGWEIAAASMSIGERAMVTIQPSYGYGDAEMGPIPAGSVLRFDMELMDFNPEKPDVMSMTSEQKIQAAAEAKEKGNEQFKKGQIAKAISAYNEGLAYFDKFEEWPVSAIDKGTQTKLALHLNLSNSHLKTKAWLEAKLQASEALHLDETNNKAMFRFGVASMNLQELVQARSCLITAAKADPKNAEIRNVLEECKQRIQADNKRAQSAFGGMFQNFDLYNDKQVISSQPDESSPDGQPGVVEELSPESDGQGS